MVNLCSHLLAIDLLRLVDLDALDQLIQHPGPQLPGPCVFVDGGDEHIRSHGPAAQLVHRGTECLDLFNKLLLFLIIPAGHFGKAVVAQLAGNIVLIDTLKESIQFFITGLQRRKLFLFQRRSSSTLSWVLPITAFTKSSS